MRCKVWVMSLGLGLTLAGAHLNAGGPGAAEGVPTFAEDVAPILYAKCVMCHRPGEVAPMSLLTYEQARPWARAMRLRVMTREMPPWGADPRYGMFTNDRSLTQMEIETIAAWAEGGAPKGDDAHMPSPPSTLAEGWHYGEPDSVIEMVQEYHVPAEGEMPNLWFYAPVPFNEDRFVRLIEWRPGNRSVVHHGNASVGDLPAGATIDYTPGNGGELILADGTRENDLAELPRSGVDRGEFTSLLDWVPGRYGFPVPSPDVGSRIPAGKYIRFGTHYQTSGKPASDRSRIGLWFTDTTDVQELHRDGVGHPLPTAVDRTQYYHVEGLSLPHNSRVRWEAGWPKIPAFAENYTAMGVTPITEPITLYGFTPHMHLRGQDMMWVVTWPDGRNEIVLSVPKYDFNWQIYYQLTVPLKIPAGSTISSVAHYNNTPKLRYNPAPDRDVFWNEQSWDEMFLPFIAYTLDSEDVKPKNARKSQG